MSGDECEKSAHGDEVPDAREMKSAKQRGQKRQLDRFPEHESGDHGKHAEGERLRVSQLLQRVVRLGLRRLWTKQKIMAEHGPYAGEIAWNQDHLSPVAAEELICTVEKAA